MEQRGDEKGRGVFCKNCPFPSRALPIPEKTFLLVRSEGPRRCLKDSDSLPVKRGTNLSHQNDKKQQGARCIRSRYTVPPVRIFQVNHTGDPGLPPETSSQEIPLALPDSIILPSPSRSFSPIHAAAGARRTCLPARGDRGASATARGAPDCRLPPAASPRPARSPADAGCR